MRCRLAVLPVAVLAGAPLALGRAQEPPARPAAVLLAPRFAAGEQVRYRTTVTVETRSRLEPMGTSATNADPLRRVFDLTWRLEVVAAAPDGSASLRATIESLQIEATPPAPAPPKAERLVGKSVAYRQAGDGRIEDVQVPPEWLEDGKPPAWLRSWLEGSQSGGGLPLRPIHLDESWQDERDIEVPGLPRQRLRAVSTYVRNSELDGVPCAYVVTRLELSGAESRQESNPDGAVFTMDSRADGQGSRLSCYDLTNGRLLESTQTTEESFIVGIRRGTEKTEGAIVMLLETQTKIQSRLRLVH